MAVIEHNNTGSPNGPIGGPRLALLLAVLVDAATLGLAVLAAAAAAATFLLLRSQAGRIDPSFRDAAAAVTLCAAVVPAWTAWQWRALLQRGTTIGGRAAGMASRTPSDAPPTRARLALHPVSIPVWYWLAATLAILAAPGSTTLEWLAAGAGILATLVAVLGLASLVLRLARPAARSRLDMTTPAPSTRR